MTRVGLTGLKIIVGHSAIHRHLATSCDPVKADSGTVTTSHRTYVLILGAGNIEFAEI